MDWTHTNPPFNVPVQIWTRFGDVRNGRSDGSYFRFDDCRHPAQNTVMPLEQVHAWRQE